MKWVRPLATFPAPRSLSVGLWLKNRTISTIRARPFWKSNFEAVADIKAVADIGGLSPEPLQDFGVRTLLIIGPTLLPVRTTTNLVESGTAF